MNPGDPVLLFALVPSDGAQTSHLAIPDLPVMFQFGGSHSRFSDKPKSSLIYPTMFFLQEGDCITIDNPYSSPVGVSQV